jgi:hypothetical protein
LVSCVNIYVSFTFDEFFFTTEPMVDETVYLNVVGMLVMNTVNRGGFTQVVLFTGAT